MLAWILAAVVVSSSGGGGNPATLPDNFATDPFATRWTKDYGGALWVWSSGTQNVFDTGGGGNHIMRYNTEMSASNAEWAKVKVTTMTGANQVGVILRSPGATGYQYVIVYTPFNTRVTWYVFDGATFVSQVEYSTGCSTMASGKTLGVVVSGTGTSTQVQVAVDPVGSFGSWSMCATLTADPSNAADAGRYVGIFGETSNAGSIVYDDFDAGGQ